MLNLTIDDKKCNRCGQCALDCPTRIIEQSGNALPRINPEKESLCLRCQHCLAICPAGALSILGKKPEDSYLLYPGSLPKFDQMIHFVRGRRSYRRYKDENVDPALLRELLSTLSNVPTGINRRELTFLTIDDKGVMHSLREKVLAGLAEAAQAQRVPDRATYLLSAIPAYFNHGADIIFRGAPHALIVTAPREAPCPEQDVVLALAYFDLLAQSAGLGTVWWGMLKMIVETLPEVGALIGIEKNQVFYAMLFGYPAIRYARTVQRDDAATIKKVLL